MAGDAVGGYGAARHAVADEADGRATGSRRHPADEDRSLVDRLLAGGDENAFDWDWGDPGAGGFARDREPLHDIPELWPDDRSGRETPVPGPSVPAAEERVPDRDGPTGTGFGGWGGAYGGPGQHDPGDPLDALATGRVRIDPTTGPATDDPLGLGSRDPLGPPSQDDPPLEGAERHRLDDDRARDALPVPPPHVERRDDELSGDVRGAEPSDGFARELLDLELRDRHPLAGEPADRGGEPDLLSRDAFDREPFDREPFDGNRTAPAGFDRDLLDRFGGEPDDRDRVEQELGHREAAGLPDRGGFDRAAPGNGPFERDRPDGEALAPEPYSRDGGPMPFGGDRTDRGAFDEADPPTPDRAAFQATPLERDPAVFEADRLDRERPEPVVDRGPVAFEADRLDRERPDSVLVGMTPLDIGSSGPDAARPDPGVPFGGPHDDEDDLAAPADSLRTGRIRLPDAGDAAGDADAGDADAGDADAGGTDAAAADAGPLRRPASMPVGSAPAGPGGALGSTAVFDAMGPARRGAPEQPRSGAPALEEYAELRRAAEHAAAAAEEAAAAAAERASGAIAAAARAAEEAEAAAEAAARAAEEARQAAEAEVRAIADAVARGEGPDRGAGPAADPEPPTQAVPLVAATTRRPPQRRPAAPQVPRAARSDEPGRPGGPRARAAHRSGAARADLPRTDQPRADRARDGAPEADSEVTAVLTGLGGVRGPARRHSLEQGRPEVPTTSRRRTPVEEPPSEVEDADEAEPGPEPARRGLRGRLTSRPALAAFGVGGLLAVAAGIAVFTSSQPEPAPTEATPAAVTAPVVPEPAPAAAPTVDPQSPEAVAFLTALRDADIPTSSTGRAETEAAAAICTQLDQGADEAQLARSVPAVLPDVTRAQASRLVDLAQQHYC